MNGREKDLGKQLDCEKYEIKELEENKVALEESLKESESKNELLREKLMQKELEISHLKTKEVCEKQSGMETFIDAETKSKLNHNSLVVDEILRIQKHPKDKISLSY